MPNVFHVFLQSIRQGVWAQRPYLLQWSVVAFAAGIALYFALPKVPPLSVAGAAVAFSLTFTLLVRNKIWLRYIAMTGSLVLFGLFYANWHGVSQGTIMLKKNLSPREVSGVVEEIEFLKTGERVTLHDVRIKGLAPKETPQRVRLSMRAKKLADIEVGMRINLRAGLVPPAGPILAGGFDFARYFYFRGIGAVGYGLNPIVIVQQAETQNWWAFWQKLRHQLSENIRARMPASHAAIATGLITGDDSAISKDIYEDLRAANLLHIIAISGSHMVVIAGVAFLLFRLLFFAIPGFGLRITAKKLAALLTLVMITAYLLITGVEISALRAYVMMVLILFAVLFNRAVRPMRALMITAGLMLLYDPSDLMEPGFQLSFAATMAMIAVAEPAFLRLIQRDEPSVLLSALYSLPWIMLVSLVAEWVTAPLVLYMFNQFAPYGMLANMMAGPVVSVLIMPAVALYFLSVPFGIESLALQWLDWGISLLLLIAKWVAGFAYSIQFLPSQPGVFIALYALALAFLCLWHGRAKWLAIPVMLVASFSFILVRSPDLVVSPDMRHIVANIDGQPYLLNGRNYALTPTMLAHAMGEDKLPYAKPSDAFMCEGKGRMRRCILRIKKQVILFDFTWDKSEAVCDLAKELQANLLITNAFGIRCKTQKNLMVINPYHRRIHGAYSWWFNDAGHVEKQLTTRDFTGGRVWSSL